MKDKRLGLLNLPFCPIKTGKHASVFVVKLSGSLLFLLFIFISCVVWILHTSSIEITFANRHVRSFVHELLPDIDIESGTAYVTWPDFSRPLLVGMKNVSARHRLSQEEIFSAQKLEVGFSGQALLKGRLSPVYIGLHTPIFHVYHMYDGLYLGQAYHKLWQTSPAKLDKSCTLIPVDPFSPVPDVSMDAFLAQGKESDVLKTVDAPKTFSDLQRYFNQDLKKILKKTGLEYLKYVSMKHAHIHVYDIIQKNEWTAPVINFKADLRHHDLKINGDIISDPQSKTPIHIVFSAIRDHKTKGIQLKADVKSFILERWPAFFPSLKGISLNKIKGNAAIDLALFADFQIEKAKIDLNIPELSVQIPAWKQGDVGLRNILLNANFNPTLQQFDITKATLAIDDVNITTTASIKPQFSQPAVPISVDAILNINHINHDQIAKYWPVSDQHSKVRLWLVDKIKKTNLANLSITLGLNIPKGHGVQGAHQKTLRNIAAEFDFSNTDIQVSDTVPLIQNGAGHGVLAQNNLTITANQAMIGQIQAKNTSIILEHLIQGTEKTFLKITGNVNGSLPNVMAFLRDKPVQFSSARLDPAKVTGQVDGLLTLALPATKDVKKSEVDVSFDGKVTHAFLPDIVRQVDLSDGDLKILIKEGGVDVRGEALLEGHAATVDFFQHLSISRPDYRYDVNVKTAISEALLQKMGLDWGSYISGTSGLGLAYHGKADQSAIVDLDLDFTSASLNIAPISYQKPVGIAANATATMTLKGDAVQAIQIGHVVAPDLTVSGASFVWQGEDIKGHIDHINHGKMDMALKFDYKKAENKIIADIKGKYVDLHALLEKPDSPNQLRPAIQATAKADLLLLFKDRPMSKADLVYQADEKGRPLYVTLDANAGIGDMSFYFRPSNQKLRYDQGAVLRFTAKDAGAALYALNIQDDIKGGVLSVIGQSNSIHLPVKGRASMTNFRMVNTPLLARLLNSISFSGLINLLSKKGISFSNMQSDFEFMDQGGDMILTLKQGGASGNAIGLTFNGTINKTKKTLNLQGKIIPITMLNNIINNIPVLGSIISGGGQTFAATYKATGSIKDPKVSVNPISALTPGILREIFFKTDGKSS